jgi:hypothetical protein
MLDFFRDKVIINFPTVNRSVTSNIKPTLDSGFCGVKDKSFSLYTAANFPSNDSLPNRFSRAADAPRNSSLKSFQTI